MAAPLYFSPRLILAAAATFGMLLTLGVHILGQRLSFNLGDLWITPGRTIPAKAAVAWWLIAAVAFIAGYVTAMLLRSAVSGVLPRRLQQILIGGGLLILMAAGQAASQPSTVSTLAGLLGGIVALFVGAVISFCGAYFALERA